MSTIILNSNIKKNTILPGDSVITIQLEQEKREEDKKIEQEKQASPSFLKSSDAEIIGESNEQCVPYAQRITGIHHPIGDGGRRDIQGNTPAVNAILVEKRWIHATVVESITDQGVWVTEANYLKGKITRRLISYNDIIGFIYK